MLELSAENWLASGGGHCITILVLQAGTKNTGGAGSMLRDCLRQNGLNSMPVTLPRLRLTIVFTGCLRRMPLLIGTITRQIISFLPSR